MSNEALHNLKQSILSSIEIHGIKPAQSLYIEALPVFSLERRQMQNVFSRLEQDQAGKWRFKPK